jgi:hypothetical protein
MNIPTIYLTEAYTVDTQVILNILTQNKPANKEDPKYNYYTKLANWVNSSHRQQKLKNIELTTIKLTDKGLIEKSKLVNKYSTLGHLLLALKNLMDQEGKYNPKNELSNLIQQTTLEILVGLSGIKDADTQPEDPEDLKDKDPEDENEEPEDNEDDTDDKDPPSDETRLRKGIDWTAEKAKRLANSEGNTSKVLSQFYDDYYRTEYAGVNPAKEQEIINKLKSLDKILIPEFNKLGYNPEVNPFASFLKILIKEKFDIFEKLTFNTYGAIHNSFISKYITGNMLGQKFDGTNILFCSDLYNKNGLDIVNYLDLQKQAHDTIPNSKYSNDTNLIAKIFIQQDVSGNTYNEKIENLLKLEKVILPGATEARLKSELEIRELYRYLFGHNAKNKKNDDINKIVEATEGDIILDMIYYLTSQYKAIIEDDDEADINKWLEDFGYKKNTTKIERCEQILSKYSKMTSARTVLSLIGKLKTKKQKETKKET